MDKDHCQFHQLPFSKLFNTYISDFSALQDFYTINPFDNEALKERADSLTSGKYKSEYSVVLKEYHDFLGIADSQTSQREKLAQKRSVAIVTGQQLGVFGGPLFTIYKTITTILKARELEKEFGRPVVPVFWLADEDHDFEEIAWVGIPEYDVYKQIKLKQEGGDFPVSDEQIQATIKEFAQELKEELHDTDFTEKLLSEFEDFYQPGKLHVQAFAQMMNHWFAEYGLLIAGSNFESVKKLAPEVFSRSISKADGIEKSLESQSQSLEKEYHRQVVVGDSNLFYLDDKKGRVKVHKSEDGWRIGDMTVAQDKFLSMIEANPHKYSPNVFLRPVLQDMLLPTLAYVAGPGELAYYGQMKDLYPHFDLEMPAIMPRLSVTLIESGIERIMEKLPFSMCSYNRRIEDLESDYVEQSNTFDVEGVFREWKEILTKSGEKPTEFIKEIDPTLEGSAGKMTAGFENELNKLKGKVYRSLKQQEETQLKRIAKIQSQLFPDGLQERSVSPVYFMNKYGLEFWDELLEHFESEGLDLQKHHIIKL